MPLIFFFIVLSTFSAMLGINKPEMKYGTMKYIEILKRNIYCGIKTNNPTEINKKL
jgi:hypothetical protein